MTSLPQEIKPALLGTIPAAIATCSKDGIPNATYISQVYWVDAEHVAISFQFFSKTIANLRENPLASVMVIHPTSFDVWTLELELDHSETEGPIFDVMSLHIEAIASAAGMSDVFKLKAADIYRVLGYRRIPPRP
jgi:hypothetical protein